MTCECATGLRVDVTVNIRAEKRGTGGHLGSFYTTCHADAGTHETNKEEEKKKIGSNECQHHYNRLNYWHSLSVEGLHVVAYVADIGAHHPTGLNSEMQKSTQTEIARGRKGENSEVKG